MRKMTYEMLNHTPVKPIWLDWIPVIQPSLPMPRKKTRNDRHCAEDLEKLQMANNHHRVMMCRPRRWSTRRVTNIPNNTCEYANHDRMSHCENHDELSIFMQCTNRQWL